MLTVHKQWKIKWSIITNMKVNFNYKPTHLKVKLLIQRNIKKESFKIQAAVQNLALPHKVLHLSIGSKNISWSNTLVTVQKTNFRINKKKVKLITRLKWSTEVEVWVRSKCVANANTERDQSHRSEDVLLIKVYPMKW